MVPRCDQPEVWAATRGDGRRAGDLEVEVQISRSERVRAEAQGREPAGVDQLARDLDLLVRQLLGPGQLEV